MVLPMIAPAVNPPSAPAMTGPASCAEAGVALAAKSDPSGKAATITKKPSYAGTYYILLDAGSHPAMNAFRAKRRFVEVDVHQGAGRFVVVAANAVRCRLAGDDYIIEGANRFIHVVQDRAADELVRAVSLPNEL